jgi:hypothetical protein
MFEVHGIVRGSRGYGGKAPKFRGRAIPGLGWIAGFSIWCKMARDNFWVFITRRRHWVFCTIAPFHPLMTVGTPAECMARFRESAVSALIYNAYGEQIAAKFLQPDGTFLGTACIVDIGGQSDNFYSAVDRAAKG